MISSDISPCEIKTDDYARGQSITEWEETIDRRKKEFSINDEYKKIFVNKLNQNISNMKQRCLMCLNDTKIFEKCFRSMHCFRYLIQQFDASATNVVDPK